MEKEKNTTIRFGQTVKLDNTPLFRTDTYPTSHRKLSGTFFLYDGKESNGRLKIVASHGAVRYKPESAVFVGWISKEDILKQITK